MKLLLVLDASDLPRFLALLSRTGQRRFYKVTQSKKHLGIGLNAVEPEIEALLLREMAREQK